MDNSRFDRAFALVIEAEGGYVNDPHDPGGETFMGITRRSHPGAWLQGRPSIDQVKAIYKDEYWDKAGCELLPDGYDIALFDAAVNQGIYPAVSDIQRGLGVSVDGRVGPQTANAALAQGQEGLALALAERASRYMVTRNFQRYGRGWLKRTYMLAMQI